MGRSVRQLWVLALLLGATSGYGAPVKNGFDLAHALVPASEIVPGGPGRDAIPAIDHPRFGVSGLLYNSDVLMYDRQTGSLWSQIGARALAGPLAGRRLTPIPVRHTTWEDWHQRHPETVVLAPDTRAPRPYTRDPYAGYGDNPDVWFPVTHQDPRYPPKEWVIGIVVNGAPMAYPFTELRRRRGAVTDTVGGHALRIRFDPRHQSGSVVDAQGDEVPSVIAYWFAWVAFHPDTGVFQARE